MAFVQSGDGTLDYFPCHYGASRLTFRGPRRDLTGEYLAMLGGTETYGRFVTAPFPTLIEAGLGIPVANLGCQNAGPDVYLADQAALDVAGAAQVVVLQITGAQNLTNRYYTVHPRRNDRFIAATPMLRSIYGEVDFTEIHFTRHLMKALADKGEMCFAPIAAELKALWLQRMKMLIQRLPRRTVLLWLSDHPPSPAGTVNRLDSVPWLVDCEMVGALRPLVAAYVEVAVPPTAVPATSRAIRFSADDEAAAQGLPGAASHREVAQALLPAVKRLL